MTPDSDGLRVTVGDSDWGPLAGPALNTFASPKIEHLDLALGRNLHVSGFEIAVDDALVVSGFEPFGHLTKERQRRVDRKRASRDSVSQSLAFDQLHDQKARARGLLEPMEGRYVRMIQRSKEARLALESGKTLGIV